MADEATTLRQRLAEELAAVAVPPLDLELLSRRPTRRRRRLALGAVAAAATAAVAIPLALTVDGHQADTLGSASRDCFTAPPPSNGQSTGYDGPLVQARLRAVRAYLATHPNGAGQPVVTGNSVVAVGFTDAGCSHLAGLAAVVPGGRAGVRVFRVMHAQSQVAAAHRRLIAAARRTDALFRRYHVVQWGPSEKGYEEVVTTDPASVPALSNYLAANFAGGDHSLFIVVAHPGAKPTPVSH